MGLGDELMITGFVEQEKKKHPNKQIVIGDLKKKIIYDSPIYKNNPNITPILNLDERSYEGGVNGKNHPITWYHEFDGGRSFYTGLGHLEKTFEDKRFKELLRKGILYATGQIKL